MTAPARPLSAVSRRRWLRWAAAGAGAAAAFGPAGAHADLPAVIAAARPSVVPVGTFNPLDSPRFTFRGSGFAVGDGSRIVTSLHVLPEAGGTAATAPLVVLVPRAGGGHDARKATVAATDREHDLAVLQVDGAPLPALALADAAPLREGTEVVLIGFPLAGLLAFSPVSHRGIVASLTTVALPAPTARQLGGQVSRLREGAFEVYQLDATAYPGNSGGPLLDATSGRVVGVVNMVAVRATREAALSQPTGISYAIPVRFLRELLREK